MKIPPRLLPLLEDGIIEDVVAQVKSGKEAEVFVVRVGEDFRCAKVYKEAQNRSFRQSAQYQEGRKGRNSRSTRAISKRTTFGQKQAEASWITAEVEALNTLSAAGLRVPTPYGFFDGVLLMELILDEDGQPAPRLDDVALSPETALLYHEEMISQIVRMLCLGIIHGDLSEFNVLVDAEGPVIIDLPQAVNAAGNNSAEMLFTRDVDNMARFFGRFAPEILRLRYAKEIWALYQKGKLTPQVELTGKFQESAKQADVAGVLSVIGDARREHEFRMGRKNPGSARPENGSTPRPHPGEQGRKGHHQAPARRPARGHESSETRRPVPPAPQSAPQPASPRAFGRRPRPGNRGGA